MSTINSKISSGQKFNLTHAEAREVVVQIEQFVQDFHKFETLGNGAAGQRARVNLLNLQKLAKSLRKWIQEIKNERKLKQQNDKTKKGA